jgi:hypothetical protein
MRFTKGQRVRVTRNGSVGMVGYKVGDLGTIDRDLTDTTGGYVSFDKGGQAVYLYDSEMKLIVGMTKYDLVAGETLLRLRNGQIKLFVGGNILLGAMRQARTDLDNYNDNLLRTNIKGSLIKDARDGDVVAHGKLNTPAIANAFSGYNSGIITKVEWTTVEHPTVLTVEEAQDKYDILIVGGKC